MEAVCYYHHEHELVALNMTKYDINNFYELSSEPYVLKTYKMPNGRIVDIHHLYRIAGTVLDKNKYRHTVTLLTTDGIVHVKFFKDQFSHFDKQLSELQTDGKKKVIEKSWFKRGNKLLLTGIRKGNMFYPKIYKNSIYKYSLYLIEHIDNQGNMIATPYRTEIAV